VDDPDDQRGAAAELAPLAPGRGRHRGRRANERGGVVQFFAPTADLAPDPGAPAAGLGVRALLGQGAAKPRP